MRKIPARIFSLVREAVARGVAAQARVETWVEAGTEVTPFYDPMLAKIVVDGATARRRWLICAALAAMPRCGHRNESRVSAAGDRRIRFGAGGISTTSLRGLRVSAQCDRCDRAGDADYGAGLSGALGYWHVGVPPSGPMDALAFRIANRLVGNSEAAAGLEFAVTWAHAALSRRCDFALTGADFGARLDGTRVPLWQAIQVSAGSTLEMTGGAGSRAPRVSGDCGRRGCAGISGQPQHFYPGRFWRTCGAASARGGCGCDQRTTGGRQRGAAYAAGLRERVGDRGAVRAARRSGFFHSDGHRDVFLDGVEGASPFRPHGHSADRSEAARGHGRMAARPGCILPTFTTTLTLSARWISRATCR